MLYSILLFPYNFPLSQTFFCLCSTKMGSNNKPITVANFLVNNNYNFAIR